MVGQNVLPLSTFLGSVFVDINFSFCCFCWLSNDVRVNDNENQMASLKAVANLQSGSRLS